MNWKNIFSFEIFGDSGYIKIEGLGGSYGKEYLEIGYRQPMGNVPHIDKFEFDDEEYSHIVNPRSGHALQSSISSVSVLGPSCIDADALATALNVMTFDEGKALIDSLEGFEAYWIIKDSKGNFKTESSNDMPIVGGS